MSVVWKSFTAVKVCAAFFVMAPLYSCWDDSVLAVQNTGSLFLCLWERTALFGADECDTGLWWPVPTAGLLLHLCAHTKLLGITFRSGSNAELKVVQ